MTFQATALVRKEVKLTGIQKRAMTVNNIALALLCVFEKHVGRANSISRAQLFYRVYKESYDDGSLRHYVMWDFVKKGMHRLRQRSNCFVASECDKKTGLWKYFVVKDLGDAQSYCDTLDNNIKRMRSMQRRARKAAQEGWHREEWKLPGHNAELLPFKKR